VPANLGKGESLLDSIEQILDRIQEKIANIGLESKVLIRQELGEVHIALHSRQMGKAHRNVRDSVRRRVRRSKRLSRCTIYLYLNPIHPGRACTTFVLTPEADNWGTDPQKMLPDEALVA
jgi:hypothetical protein